MGLIRVNVPSVEKLYMEALQSNRKHPRICLKCRRSTKGRDWIEVMGIRMCMECLKKSATERRNRSCSHLQQVGYNGPETTLTTPAVSALATLTSMETSPGVSLSNDKAVGK